MAEIETGRESRQGVKGKPVLYVLIAAVVLAVIAGAGMLTWQSEKTTSDPASQSQDAARGTATGSSNTGSQQQPANPTNASPAQPKH